MLQLRCAQTSTHAGVTSLPRWLVMPLETKRAVSQVDGMLVVDKSAGDLGQGVLGQQPK